MILDIVACLLMWGAIQVQRLKKEDTGSSLDNFHWAMLQGLIIAASFIILKNNPYQ